MRSAPDKYILSMIHAQVLSMADIRQAVITTPAIGIDDAIQGNMASYNALERGFTAVRDDFCVDALVALEYSTNSRFAASPTTSLAFDALGAEVRLIDFDLASER